MKKQFMSLMIRPVILDVDYDFFFDSEDWIPDFPNKTLQKETLDSFSDLFRDVSLETVVSHDEALYLWQKNNYKNITCLHIDYHHDWNINNELMKSLTPQSSIDIVNCGNYAAIGAKLGIIKNFIWVRPDALNDYEIINPRELYSLNEISFMNLTWSEFKNLFFQNFDASIIESGIMCLSPDFIPEKNMWEFFKEFNCNKEFISKSLLYRKNALQA